MTAVTEWNDFMESKKYVLPSSMDAVKHRKMMPPDAAIFVKILTLSATRVSSEALVSKRNPP